MKNAIIIFLVIVAIGLWQHGENLQHQAKVYEVCNQSRISATISETECGQLQDKWGIEFLCNTNDTNPNTTCWTEKK